jgi:hypothetical protein
MQTTETELRFVGYERRRKRRLPWFALACIFAAVGFGYEFIHIAEHQQGQQHTTSAQPTQDVRNPFNDW